MSRGDDAAQFERLIQSIFEGLLRIDGLDDVSVRRNVVLEGHSGPHQIDVLWDFSIAGTSYSTIVEAKQWKRFVGMREVRAFKALLDDLPRRAQGVMISSNGFQRGARRFASQYGIQLCTLVSAEDSRDNPLVAFHEVGSEINCTLLALAFLSTDGKTIAALVPITDAKVKELYIVGGGMRRPLAMYIDIIVHRALAEGKDELTLDFFDDYYIEDANCETHFPVAHVGAKLKRFTTPRIMKRDLRAFYSFVLSGLSTEETVLVAPDDKIVRLPKGARIGMCDFCGWPIPRDDNDNTFQSRNIGMRSLGGTVDGFISQMGGDAWGACQPCADAIRRWDVEFPVRRHVEMSRYLADGKTAAEARHFHDLFWLGYLKEQLQDKRNLADPAFVALAKEYQQMEAEAAEAYDAYFGSEVIDAAARMEDRFWPGIDTTT